ncbi:MAG TPA: hypothetical protein VFD75_04790, partial [Pyrinomonadaceae bacterium]|nr:hypothetical protein [Pyrinomonadaceae bacterium]
ADLETQSMKRFDDGNAKATKQFEDNVNNDIDAFKEDRYSGMFGWARHIRDWVKGIDDLPPVKAIFDRNREQFVATINKLVEDISNDNKRVIQECKDELQRARTEIKEYVDKLGPSLKDIGKKAAAEMNSKLDEMDKFVAKKEEDLQNKLKDKQTAAIKAIDEKIEKMKEAMAGALAKLGKLLLWAAKKFFTWALEKFGFNLADIENIINKGAAVLKAIFTKPIQFVKNLMNAAILGFQNFGKNFLKHLKDALFEWLTGSLQGIVLPSTWDFPGIVSVALQMIGLTYANIRSVMVEVMGEPVVAGLEKTFTLVKTLMTEGPMAAWDQLKGMAAEMRDAFIDAVKDFIKQKIIEQAIQWLVSLFVPGAGIIKAIIGIYDTVVFFIKKAKQIMEMISNFLGSISEIAAGNIGAAADAMEQGLARGLSLVINFLAALLRLSGITNKIRDAIQKIRDKVRGVLLKIAKWIWEKGKALVGKAVGAVKAGVTSIANWWKARTKLQAPDGEHTLMVEGTQAKPTVMIASVPQSLRDYLAANLKAKDMKAIEPYLVAVENTVTDAVAKQNEQPDKAQQRVQLKLDALRDALKGVLKLDVPPTVIVNKPASGLAKRVVAKPLTRLAGNTSPSDARDSLKSHGPAQPGQLLMNQLNKVQTGGVGYSRLHMLSFRLMGPDQPWNLIPGDAKANKDMESVESASETLIKGAKIKAIKGKNRKEFIRFYDITATYQSATTPKGANQFADQITIRHGIYDPLTDEELDEKTPSITPSKCPPAPGAVVLPNYSTDGGPSLNVELGNQKNPNGGTFPASIGTMIVMARSKMEKSTNTNKFSFERLRDYGAGIISAGDIEGLIELVRKSKADIK